PRVRGGAGGVGLAVDPVDDDVPRVVVRARVVERAEAEAVALALVRALVRGRLDDRVHVVDGDAARVLADPAVLVPDFALDGADAVVGRGARRAGGRAERAVAGAIAAVERVLEAGGSVGAGRVARAAQEEVEVGALADRPVAGEGRGRRDVVDVDVERLRVEGAVLVGHLDGDRVAAAGVVVVGVALRAERALRAGVEGRVRRAVA